MRRWWCCPRWRRLHSRWRWSGHAWRRWGRHAWRRRGLHLWWRWHALRRRRRRTAGQVVPPRSFATIRWHRSARSDSSRIPGNSGSMCPAQGAGFDALFRSPGPILQACRDRPDRGGEVPVNPVHLDREAAVLGEKVREVATRVSRRSTSWPTRWTAPNRARRPGHPAAWCVTLISQRLGRGQFARSTCR